MIGRGHAAAQLSVIRAPRRMPMVLTSPVQDHLRNYALINARTKPMRVLHEGEFAGRTLALCGAGPSLDPARIADGDYVVACNSAAPWLAERGVRLNAAVTIDQTAVMLRDWAVPPRCEYWLASTVDPVLVAHLRAFERPIRFFHSAVGFGDDEFDVYCRHYPPTIMAGTGYSVVGRMLGVAKWLGFERVDIHGADHAFGPNDVAHCNGETAEHAYTTPMVMAGVIDGREWRTRADMLIGAVDLVKRVQNTPGYVRLIGDTLPAALLDKDTEYLDNVCRVLAPGEVVTT